MLTNLLKQNGTSTLALGNSQTHPAEDGKIKAIRPKPRTEHLQNSWLRGKTRKGLRTRLYEAKKKMAGCVGDVSRARFGGPISSCSESIIGPVFKLWGKEKGVAYERQSSPSQNFAPLPLLWPWWNCWGPASAN